MINPFYINYNTHIHCTLLSLLVMMLRYLDFHSNFKHFIKMSSFLVRSIILETIPIYKFFIRLEHIVFDFCERTCIFYKRNHISLAFGMIKATFRVTFIIITSFFSLLLRHICFVCIFSLIFFVIWIIMENCNILFSLNFLLLEAGSLRSCFEYLIKIFDRRT